MRPASIYNTYFHTRIHEAGHLHKELGNALMQDKTLRNLPALRSKNIEQKAILLPQIAGREMDTLFLVEEYLKKTGLCHT